MLLFSLICALFASSGLASEFGYEDGDKHWTIKTGKDLVIKVSKANADIESMNYKGVEYNGYDGKNTQVESGICRNNQCEIKIEKITKPEPIIKVSAISKTLKHYIVFRHEQDHIYLFTDKIALSTKTGDTSTRVQRYIVRMRGGVFKYEYRTNSTRRRLDSDYYPEGASFIEASDVMAFSDGTTWSKHYNGEMYGRTMDFDFVGTNTSSVGVWMVRSNHEKASGGAFFRSLQRRAAPDGVDLYDIYYYGMANTDVERPGLQGPSVIVFTGGSPPEPELFASNADNSWVDTLNIDGWVPLSGRGGLSGVGLKNMKPGYNYTVQLSNYDAQYWGPADATTGKWRIDKALPGEYNLTVYKDELEVHRSHATITADKMNTLDQPIQCDDPSDTPAIWRIGEWDGTPAGFINFVSKPWKPTFMHPSDKRLDKWAVGDFTVGTSPFSAFPSYIWRDVNNNQVIRFKLTDEQRAENHTVRLGVTVAAVLARPRITVNGWKSAMAPQTLQPTTRTLTIGTYRANNAVFEYGVPSTAWEKSADAFNVLTIDIFSTFPQNTAYGGYLSPAISVDCIDLV